MKSAVLAFLALATSNWALCIADNQVKGTEVDCSRYIQLSGVGFGCPRIRNEICGTNQNTYGNECLLCTFNFQEKLNIRKLHDGPCIVCPKEEKPVCTMEYMPLCGSDGNLYGNKCDFCNAFVKSQSTLTLSHYGEC